MNLDKHEGKVVIESETLTGARAHLSDCQQGTSVVRLLVVFGAILSSFHFIWMLILIVCYAFSMELRSAY